MDEATLVIIKPDGLQKSLTGNVLTRLAETKLVIIAAKIKAVSRKLAEEHYCHMKDKPFFEEIVKYIMGEEVDWGCFLPIACLLPRRGTLHARRESN